MMHLSLLALATVCTGDSWIQAAEAALAPFDRKDAPGGAVAVLVDGNAVWTFTYGMADLESDLAVTRESRFYFASLAKPFTAACVVHAATHSGLELDSSLHELFPELPESYGAATLRHCLHHRSGIPDVYDATIGAELDHSVIASNANAIELLGQLPNLTFSPGSSFLYSNSGYVLLAEAIERVTKSDLATYAQAHCFGPLGMEQAAYVGDERFPILPVSYSSNNDYWEPREPETGLRGPGGLMMSLADLIKWEEAWTAGAWGDENLRAELVKAPLPPHHPKLGPYAAGWMLPTIGGLRAERHNGEAFGHSADLLRFPDTGVSIIVLSNRADVDAQDVSSALAKIVLGERYQERGEQEGVSLNATQQATFGRLWTDPATRQPWMLFPGEGRFMLISLGDIRLDLIATSPTRLEAVDSQSPFALTLDDSSLVIEQEG
ncbi:MAG: CubicO group peptidase (beta-lactamase class C family), partial [Planctomycetota bacterium]